MDPQFYTPGVGPTTGDNRLNVTSAAQYRIYMDTFLHEDPKGEMILSRMAGQAKLKPHSNEAITFTKSITMGTLSTLSAERQKSTGNVLTSDPTKGGVIASKAVGLKFETFKLQEVYTFGAEVSADKDLDDAVLDVQTQARINADAYMDSWEIVKHQEILSNMISANTWCGDNAKNVSTLTLAIAADATTFRVSEAFAANLYAGAFVHVADKIERNSATGQTPTPNTVMVASLAAASGGNVVVTIETDPSNFPVGFEQEGVTDGHGKIFKKLSTSFDAHANGTRIQTDYPLVLTKDNADSEFAQELKYRADKAKISGKNRTVYTTLEVVRVIENKDNPLVQNDFLGKGILTDGQIGTYRGLNIAAEDIAAKRVLGVNTLHYSWLLQRGETVFWKELTRKRAINEKLTERADMLGKDTYFDVYGSHCPRSGRVKSVVQTSVLSAFTAPS